MNQRKSGLLLHISSLPSAYGVGDFGSGAYHFLDSLALAKQSCWQILPLNPTDPICGSSPYSSHSAYALNIIFVSPDLLVKEGYLQEDDLSTSEMFDEYQVNYEQVTKYKKEILAKAYQNFKTQHLFKEQFELYIKQNAYWLDDYALFVVIKNAHGGQIWSQWPSELRDRNAQALKKFYDDRKDEIQEIKFQQFVLHQQWHQLKAYAKTKRVQIIGDIPIYVIFDSADVWKDPDVFKLTDDKQLSVVAGVPPDYFSKTGQRWGNPVYDWDVLKKGGYQWWLNRFQHAFEQFDYVRVDHFRGFVNFWEILAHEPSAINGYWQDVPTDDFFATLHKTFNPLPIIAEDLGIISDDVRAVITKLNFPGMKILLFAFSGNLTDHPYLPRNYNENCVVYTGTHDNNTVRGWFAEDATQHEKKTLASYLKFQPTQEQIHWELVKVAMNSPANLAMIPVQDVLGLDEKARMNQPAKGQGNWQWRMDPKSFDKQIIEKLADLTEKTHR